MPTVEASGQQLADGTEQTLATVATNRSLILRVDVSPLAAGETLILRVKERVLAAGTDRLVFPPVVVDGTGGTGSVIAVSVPISSPHQAVFSLEQDPFGTFRTFDWSVESL